MPLLNGIVDHPLIGPKIREEIEIGRGEGVRGILLPCANATSSADLGDTALALLDAPTLEAILP
jgi:hypothetical protein